MLNVVTRVLKECKVTLDVAKHPVGLDELEQEFHKNIALQHVAGPIQIKGIWGMGGIGKTTFAKHLYNKNRSIFKKSSFLYDIRDAAREERLHEKQKELLKELDLGIESTDIKNVHQGKDILRSRLRLVRVLIVLDDVDHTHQLDALLPAVNNLGGGSLIIVTTRDMHVLISWGISSIYKIPTLNLSHAKQLFCWHAFKQASPKAEFEELVQKFIDACHSLPLSLVVIGSQLYGESSHAYWQSQLDKLSRVIPKDIESRLKISYDGLDKEEKEMFLDVACFFNGFARDIVIATWDSSGWNGLHGLQKLEKMCFVELDERPKPIIRMHEYLKNLGRDIANQHSLYRLWSKNQIIEIQPQQEAIRIRGMANAFGDNCYLRHGKIILNTSQGERSLMPGSLGLKIFIGRGDFLNGECTQFSRELVCFSCYRFAHKNLPSWLPLKNLRILELVEPQKLEDLWKCDEDVPLQLRHLRIEGSYGLKNISALQRLRSLEKLIIYDCKKLKILPSLAEASSLRILDLRDCKKLEKIEKLDGLMSLETFRIYDCTELKTLPSLAEATFLKEIDLRRCNKLDKIESLKGLRSLETLKIHDSTDLKILPSLAEATSLKKIDLRCCKKLEKIESLEGLRSLERLITCYCTELNTLPSLAEATFLEEIDLRGCNKLGKIESLGGLRSLQTLRIYDCTELNTLPSLGEATSLKKIDLRRCNKLEKIKSLEGLRSLETLRIYDCTELNTLPSLAEATFLKEIELRNCNKLGKIESLEGLRSLENFSIYDCAGLYILPSLGGATSLNKIDLSCCSKLEKIESLEGLRSLKILRIHDCTELHTLPSLAELTCLEVFKLRRCYKIHKVEGFEVLRSLKKLAVHICWMRSCVLNLEQSEGLKSLEVVANRVVVEPSIRDMQEVKICSRAETDVMSLGNFFTSLHPDNVMEHALGGWGGVGLKMPESTANAILICFITHSVYPNVFFKISTDNGKCFSTEISVQFFCTEMSNGKWLRMGIFPQESIWLWMGVFPQESKWLHTERYQIVAFGAEHREVKVKEGWLLRGADQSISEAFSRLSQS